MFKFPFERKEQKILKALAGLADGCNLSSCIADKLEALNIKGTVRSPSFCPIAKYLRYRTGISVTVGEDSVRFNGSEVAIPAVISSFILNFDNREYSNLIERGIL